MTETKLNRVELLNKLMEIVRSCTTDPADELIALGNALVEAGAVLKGHSVADQRATIIALQVLEIALRQRAGRRSRAPSKTVRGVAGRRLAPSASRRRGNRAGA
jgi:hypothetical protein